MILKSKVYTIRLQRFTPQDCKGKWVRKLDFDASDDFIYFFL